jgi:two-component system, sensor histidine kinase and response regulator
MDVPRQLANLNKALALERLCGDEQLLGEIAGLFLGNYPSLMVLIRDAVSRRDASALQHAAHALKGSVANFCAQAAVESAYQLECMGRAGDLAGAEDTLAALEQQLQSLEPALVALQQASASQP